MASPFNPSLDGSYLERRMKDYRLSLSIKAISMDWIFKKKKEMIRKMEEEKREEINEKKRKTMFNGEQDVQENY